MARNISFSTPAVQYGFIAGIVYTLGLVILYLLGDYYFAGTFGFVFSFRLFPYLAAVAIAIYAGVSQKNITGGYINFANAFLTVLLALLIAEAFYILVMWLLYNVIDPGLGERVKAMQIAQMQETYTNLGMSEGDIDKIVAAVEAQDMSFGMKALLISALFSIILSIVIALITAAIIKKERPEHHYNEATPIDAN